MKYTLVGIDGNAFAIMGYVKKAMETEGYSRSDIDLYVDNAKSSDYNHLVSVSLDKIHEVNAKRRRES